MLRSKFQRMTIGLVVAATVITVWWFIPAVSEMTENRLSESMNFSIASILLNQNNSFDHCDAMNDIWTEQITFLKPLRLMYCPIPKNMNTQLWALFTRTYSNETFQLENETDLHRFWDFRETQETNNVTLRDSLGSNILELQYESRYELFSIIRHPFNRFISAFYHLCNIERACDHESTNYCKGDIYCMLSLLHTLEQDCLWHNYSYANQAMLHFAPQAYLCYFRKMKNATRLFVYEDNWQFRETVTNFVLSKGIPYESVMIGWGSHHSSWLNASTYHKTADMFAREKLDILANLTMLRELYQIYRADFKMFQFSMPDSVLRHCANSDANLSDDLCMYLRHADVATS